jgi:hypothetical protein
MATMTMTRTEGSLTTEIPHGGVEALQTPFGFTVYAPPGRRYNPSWVSLRWQLANVYRKSYHDTYGVRVHLRRGL